MDPQRKLLTADEVAAILNVSKPQAYRLMNTILPSVRFNRTVRVRQQDLDIFIQMHLSAGQSVPFVPRLENTPQPLPATGNGATAGVHPRRTDESNETGDQHATQTR